MSESETVYLVSFIQKMDGWMAYDRFKKALSDMDGIDLMPNQVLVTSPKSATELYLQLREHLRIGERDRLFIAEITTNSIGSYLTEADTPVAAKIATRLAKARR